MKDQEARSQQRSFEEQKFLTESGEKHLLEHFPKYIFFCSLVLVALLILPIFTDSEDIVSNQATTSSSDEASGGEDEEVPEIEVIETMIPEDPYPGRWIYPLMFININQERGLHGNNGDSVDLKIPEGREVFAVARGRVIKSVHSGYGGGYGHHVIIRHPDGRDTVYGHLSEVYVSNGDKARQGQVIGLSGNTGNSTGPHLHFEVRYGENPIVGLLND